MCHLLYGCSGALAWYVFPPSPVPSTVAADSSLGLHLLSRLVSSPVALQSYSAGLLAGCASYVACRRAACGLSVLLRVSSSSPRVLSLPLSAASIYASGCVAAHTVHCTTYWLSTALSANGSAGELDALRVLSRYHWPFARPGQLPLSL